MLILMIDDEAKLREKVKKFLALKGYELLEADSAENGLKILLKREIDLILLDLRMPGMDGLSCLKEIKTRGYKTEVIIISAHGEIKDAVQAMKLGATDYLTKPFYLDQLLIKIKQIEDKLQLKRTNCYLQALTQSQVIFESPKMQAIMHALEKVATSDTPVLLTGETGVGKEVLARWIHNHSNCKGNFIAINCGAIPENLLESELFGHEKGAFSGAHKRKIGKLELAQNGTIFLDEIGELAKPMQVKLLRVLQERELERVGSIKIIPLNIRIITATNRDINEEIQEGRFREDLFYRISVLTFLIPPLRERKEDILPLAKHFIREFNLKLSKEVEELTEETKNQLLNYNYPGNVRELRNIVERSILLSAENKFELFLEIAEQPKNTQLNNPEKMTLAEMEALRIKEVLAKFQGNRTKAAEELGISRRTIINKIKLYAIE